MTLHRIMAHMIAETHRHAGHADIVRELIDGAVGRQRGHDNMAPGGPSWWEGYLSRVEEAARAAAAEPGHAARLLPAVTTEIAVRAGRPRQHVRLTVPARPGTIIAVDAKRRKGAGRA